MGKQYVYRPVAFHGSVLYVPRTPPKTLIERLREARARIRASQLNKK